MRINKKAILVFSMIIFLSLTLNIIFYYSQKIEGPLFTYIYSEASDFELTYLMDQDEKDKVEKISFPEIDETEYIIGYQGINDIFMDYSNNKEDIRYDDGCARYNIYRIELQLLSTERSVYGENLSSKLEDSKSITKIKYKTEKGRRGECEIGKLIYNKSNNKIEEPLYRLYSLNEIKVGDSYYEERYKANDDIEIIKIEGEFKEELLDYFDININGENLKEIKLPVKLKYNDELNLSIKNRNKFPFYKKYNPKLDIILRDPEGTEQKIELFKGKTYRDYIDSDITYGGVKKLLKLREDSYE